MDEYEEKLFEGVKNITTGKRSLPRGTTPRRKKQGKLAQDILDEII